jgi:anthranilate phosphoribosyltransferase
VARCIEELGVGFLFAPKHHNAMKHAIGPRREMGVRTLFNLLGPLTNPAAAPNQVLGVFSSDWIEPLALVLQRLGSHHVLVVNAEDGLDEISVGAATQVAELHNDTVRTFRIEPEQFGIQRSDIACLKVTDATESLAMIRQVFAGEPGAALDIVALNAGAAIYVAGLVETLAEGVRRAQDVIGSGAAQAKFDALIAFTKSLS